MKLNKSSKGALKAEIIEQLKKVPNGQRIQLDKDLLEDLLFEVVTIDKEKDIKVKLPIWSGDFLKRIDLSQVDFTNVSWCILDMHGLSNYRINFDGITVSDDAHDQIKKIREDKIENGLELSYGFAITYDGTNANIDLTRSFEAIYGKFIKLRECNFTGVDFSHQNLTGIQFLELNNSSISKTQLSIPSIVDLRALNSYFNEIDLSTRAVDAGGYFMGDVYHLAGCDLRNSGIHINLNGKYFKDGQYQKKIYTAMNDDWIGCYVNGKRVLSLEEKQAIAHQKREEYEKMKAEIFGSVTSSIEEQTGHMKKIKDI